MRHLIRGKTYTEPPPDLRQVIASSVLGGLLLGSFQRGSGNPGGWVILDRPTIQFGDDVIIPDLAGFRAERAPRPTDEPSTTIIPDWICEVLSPRRDASVRVAKMLAYAREGVHYAWLLEPLARTLEVLKLNAERAWEMVEVFDAARGHTRARAIPFDEILLDLDPLW